MPLLLAPDALAARAALARPGGALHPLASSLVRELHATLAAPPAIPHEKARLTRRGGRCPACGGLLDFDPWGGERFTCRTCGIAVEGDDHRGFWLLWQHLWTAEQALRGALLDALLHDPAAAARADAILATYADTYLAFENRDNVLGPTRVFFSTYLESIWLLQLALALDLREARGTIAPSLAARVRDRLVEPSAALVASYDEGRSNRQAWRAAALLAAGGVLHDDALRDAGAGALAALAGDALLDDGSWYEGENYHLFAHRGLATALALAEACGRAPARALVARIERGFAAPFATMLPDGTFPARRDSQYGVSLRQWRTADLLECGLARSDDPRLRAALAACYADDLPAGETGRATSAADAERNLPPVRLTRADCSWRALLLARPELPPLDTATPASVLLPRQGLAILRRDAGRTYVALDFGETGGGHGHPDRLNLLIATPRARRLDDMGTGSYTDPSLAWYRSTLAHAAPFVGDADQPEARGTLVAFEDRGGAGWVEATWRDPVRGVTCTRSVVVMPDHVVDRLAWRADGAAVVTLPLPVAVAADVIGDWETWHGVPAQLARWLGEARACALAPDEPWRATVHGVVAPHAPDVGPADTAFDLTVVADGAARLWYAPTPGPPGSRAPHGVLALRQEGTQGGSWRVLAAPGAVRTAHADGDALVIACADGTMHRHERVPHGWLVTLAAGGARSSIDLGGLVAARPAEAGEGPEPTVPPDAPPLGAIGGGRPPLAVILDGAHWRRGDLPYEAIDGGPTATVRLDAQPASLVVAVDIALGTRDVALQPALDENPLDNEHPDTNADGVQLHYVDPDSDEWCTLLAVPEPGGRLRIAATGAGDRHPAGRWHARPGVGWEAVLVLDWPTDRAATLRLDLCVNVRPPGFERRAGQLVLSGGRGEWTYLRGDRQPRDRACAVRLDPVPAS